MKEYYIKITPKQTEAMAVAKAKELGYKDYDGLDKSNNIYNDLLILDTGGDYYYGLNNEQELINNGYTELKLTEEYIRGEMVEVRDGDYNTWEKRIYLTTIEGANYPYQVVDEFDEDEFKDGEIFTLDKFKQIRKLKEVKEYTMKEYTIKELQEKLGEEFKIIKE